MTRQKRAELKSQAAELAAEALKTLAELMRRSTSDQVRVAAARELLDRAHGKPRGEDGAREGQSWAEMVDQSYKPEQMP